MSVRRRDVLCGIPHSTQPLPSGSSQMYRTSLLPVIAAVCVLVPAIAGAQRIATETPLTVYMDVRASADDSPAMATFAGKLLELAVTDIPGVQFRNDQANPCTAFAVPNRALPPQAQQTSRSLVSAEPEG